MHDEEVAKRWEMLKSGKITDEIAPLTWKLYKEGKLIDDYFSGNPNLPTAPAPRQKVIEIKTEKLGEFASIVQSFIDCQKPKLIEKGGKNSDEKQITLKDTGPNIIKKKDLKNMKKYKYASEEFENEDNGPEVGPLQKKRLQDNGDLPFSQFKKILHEETTLKNSKYKDEYDDFVMQETSDTEKNTPTKQSLPTQNCFLKISKYERENVSLNFEKTKNTSSVYKYDEKLGYQYPVGKNIKGKIRTHHRQHQKGKLYKVGQCVYDDDGEFLYKVPS